MSPSSTLLFSLRRHLALMLSVCLIFSVSVARPLPTAPTPTTPTHTAPQSTPTDQNTSTDQSPQATSQAQTLTPALKPRPASRKLVYQSELNHLTYQDVLHYTGMTLGGLGIAALSTGIVVSLFEIARINSLPSDQVGEEGSAFLTIGVILSVVFMVIPVGVFGWSYQGYKNLKKRRDLSRSTGFFKTRRLVDLQRARGLRNLFLILTGLSGAAIAYKSIQINQLSGYEFFSLAVIFGLGSLGSHHHMTLVQEDLESQNSTAYMTPLLGEDRYGLMVGWTF